MHGKSVLELPKAYFCLLKIRNIFFVEIEIGLLKTNVYYTMIAYRKEAVCYAIEYAQSGDMILIAGKGHENYQEIRGIRYPMNDKELVRECTQMLL